jgi:hypothetical protein
MLHAVMPYGTNGANGTNKQQWSQAQHAHASLPTQHRPPMRPGRREWRVFGKFQRSTRVSQIAAGSTCVRVSVAHGTTPFALVPPVPLVPLQ